jgi:thiol:disulfide interchange protein DsbA
MSIRPLLLIAGLLIFGTAAHAAGEAAPDYQAGTSYQLIDPPQPTASGSKVEVLEVFSYACPHCAHFQPYAETLKSKLPANAVFDLMPADFQPRWVVFARGFYAAKALGLVAKTHQALFDSLYRDSIAINTIEELADFYAANGADRNAFLSTAQSFVIDGNLSHAHEMEQKYGVDSTPTLIINGKYRVVANPDEKIGFEQMVDIALYLVAQESKKKH